MDDRQVQESAADARQSEVVKKAQDSRTRLLEGLDALEHELQKVRKEAEALPPYTPYFEKPRKRWLPW